MLFTLQCCKRHIHLLHERSYVETEKSDSSRLVEAVSAVKELASHQTILSKYGFLAKQRAMLHCYIDKHMCIYLFFFYY